MIGGIAQDKFMRKDLTIRQHRAEIVVDLDRPRQNRRRMIKDRDDITVVHWLPITTKQQGKARQGKASLTQVVISSSMPGDI